MSSLKLKNKSKKRNFRQRYLSPTTLTIIFFLSCLFFIALAGFTEQTTITNVVAQFSWWQVPGFSNDYYVLIPTILLLFFAQFIMILSPQGKPWSRSIIAIILLFLGIRYLLWRSLTTLNLANPVDGIFSLLLLFMEMVAILSHMMQMYLILRVKSRQPQANQMEVAVKSNSYYPSVDIFVPTYNESVAILRRTIIGCQAIQYDNKKIYLLDDKRRDKMRNLAEELGCEYLTRPNNLYAKAGNLNHALGKTNGELIVCFDADFVPTKNFLQRTIGFFQDVTIGLVQTHQGFYNHDSIARNLGLENSLTHEVEIFSRYYEVLRDSLETCICYGSSFVVRRSHLEGIGGFVTKSITEDYFTSVALSAKSHRVIYLNECLSAGLVPENIGDHIRQRLRWSRGTMQGFFIKENLLTISGMPLIQRIANLEGIFYWMGSILRVLFLLMPLIYTFFHIIPVRTTGQEWLYFFLPYYLIQLATFSWINHRSRSFIASDIYNVSQCFPLALNVIQTLISPFSQGFKVTPKGVSSERFIFNWGLALPLIVLFFATAASFWHNIQLSLLSESQLLEIFQDTEVVSFVRHAWIWNAYNLLMIGLSLLVFIDVPKPNLYDWFALRRAVNIEFAGQTWRGVTTKISEVGMEVNLNDSISSFPADKLLHSPVKLTLFENKQGIDLSGLITEIMTDKSNCIRLQFTQVSLQQQRQLVEMLFCRPGQWQKQQVPGEFKSVLFLIKALLMPRFLFSRRQDSMAVTVLQK